jgi:hypothetical protein
VAPTVARDLGIVVKANTATTVASNASAEGPRASPSASPATREAASRRRHREDDHHIPLTYRTVPGVRRSEGWGVVGGCSRFGAGVEHGGDGVGVAVSGG